MGKDVTVVTATVGDRLDWVVVVYRVPREPSSPRIAIWRRLRNLGVGQLGDGVVALPEDARTREHLEWIADQVTEAGGSALLLRAQALSAADEQAMASAMARARAQEYHDLAAAAHLAAGTPPESPADRSRTLKRLRRELRAIQRRDYFPPAERDAAVAAVRRLAAAEPVATTMEHHP